MSFLGKGVVEYFGRLVNVAHLQQSDAMICKIRIHGIRYEFVGVEVIV